MVIGPREKGALRSGASLGRIKARFQLPGRSVWTEITFQEGAKARQVWESEDGITGSEKPFYVPCSYFSSWRAPRPIGPLGITAGKGGRPPSDTEDNRLWITKQYIVNAKAHAQMSDGSETSRYREIIDRLDETWRLFYPGESHSFGVEPVSDDPESGFDVFLCGPGDRKIPVDSLSSGQLELFTFAASLLLGNSREGIICIDEPELHLDPQWHQVMLRAMRKLRPGAQIIAATHSPGIFDAALSSERRFLVSDEDPRAITWKKTGGNG